MKGVFLSALFLCWGLFCIGQSSAQINDISLAYPDDDKVILIKTEDIVFEVIDNKLITTSSTYEESLWLTAKAQYQRKDGISYGLFDQLVYVSAKTLVPHKNKVTEYKVDNFTYSDFLESGVFHDDLKLVTFNYPNLNKGCRTIKEFSNKTTDPHFLTGYFFGSAYPTESSSIKITVPDNVKMQFKLFNCDNCKIQYSFVKKGNNTIHTWRADKTSRIQAEDNASGIRSITPHIVYYVEEFITPEGRKHKVFSNTDDLHAWYSDMIRNVNSEHEYEIISRVDSLTKGIPNEIDKVKAIYYWVQDHIKYIAVEYGIGGFQPRPADLVLKRRYGDCKDMTFLIYSMLEYAGIESSLTWIGTRDIPYSYSDLPTPSVNNHMIITYINEGKYYFLDATSGFLPIDLPSTFIQGKEAMIDFGLNRYEIVRVPEVADEKSILNDSVIININGNNLKGEGHTLFGGYYGVDITAMINLQDDSETRETLEKDFFKGSNKYHLLNYKIEDLNNREKPVKLSYSFFISDYAIDIDSNIFINLNLDKTILNNKIENERKTDFIFDFKGNQKLTISLKIPDGYTIDFIPEDSNFQYTGFGYTITYKVINGSILFSRQLKMNTLKLKKADFQQWNSMVNLYQDISRNVVVLKKL